MRPCLRPGPLPLPARVARRTALLAALALALGACGGGGGGGGSPPPIGSGCAGAGGPPITISGVIQYQRLVLSPVGLGPALESRPARFVDVEVRQQGGGPCYGITSTDATGAYSIVVTPPASTALEVVAYAKTGQDPLRDLTAHEADPPFSNSHSDANVYAHVGGTHVADGDGVVGFTVPYNPGHPTTRPSIGFGALDVMVTCWEGVRLATGLALPAVHVYTRLGNNAALGSTSFFRPGAWAIALLGGAAGNLDNSDTDYFDDAVIAHEFCHFVEEAISFSQSRGGSHAGAPIEPNFAWSEGQATGFGCLLLGTPLYRDTFTTNSSSPSFGFSAENVVTPDPPGIGGELTVAEIVWDLGDGGAGPTDTDGDGIALPLSELLAATLTFDPAADGVYLGLFLDRLVALSATLTAGQLAAFLAGPPENQGVSYPLAGADVWPTAIGLGDVALGQVDSLPANPPNLSVKDPCRGLTSSAWYHLVLPQATTVRIDLDIQPVAGSGDNLDLFLTTNAQVFQAFAASTNSGATDEQIGPITLAAGTWFIRVEANCGGSGNKADYVLTVVQE